MAMVRWSKLRPATLVGEGHYVPTNESVEIFHPQLNAGEFI